MKSAYRWLFAAGLIACMIGVRFTPFAHVISLEVIQYNKHALAAFVRDNLLISSLVFCLAYAFAVALSLPGAAVLTMLAGYLFGVWYGCVVVNISATAGAVGACAVVRYVIGRQLQLQYGHRLIAFNAALQREGVFYLLSIRLIAVIPFFVINILAGLTRVPLTTFAWTTSLGIIPGSLVFVYAGQQLGHIDSVGQVFSPGVVGAFALLGLLALLPVIVRRMRG